MVVSLLEVRLPSYTITPDANERRLCRVRWLANHADGAECLASGRGDSE